jgi:group I intron endonuclease
MYGVIYRISNNINNKVYIGQTIAKNPRARWGGHKSSARTGKSNAYIHKAMRKYGIPNFEFTVVCICESQFQLDMAEKLLIEAYDSTNSSCGYNLELGGNGPGKASEELRRINSEAHKGRPAWNKGIPRTAEEKRLMSENRKGIGLGIKHSAEWSNKTAVGRRKPAFVLGFLYASIVMASDVLNISQDIITKQLRGTNKNTMDCEYLIKEPKYETK